ncbi:MAG: TrkA C-terminal domain-containing protein [Erysipelotrichaceae bacterium]|nr:TrkA C-terminal domain-containing protein [Erysipelotrichaceae bacterium]
MNIYAAFSLFALIILVYWIINELFTILFRFMGLPEERARFQVTSLLTGCGFTTRESEFFISSRSRRRLARVTMLFGYVFNITIVSSFINLFLSFQGQHAVDYFIGLLIPLASVGLIFAIIRTPSMRNWIESVLSGVAGRFVKRKDCNTILLMDYIGKDSIAQITLRQIPEAYNGVPLSKTNLKSELNLLVMLVEHPSRKTEPVSADTVFQVGDKLTMFGSYAAMRKAFHAEEDFNE